MAKRIIGYYEDGEWHKIGEMLYTTTGQNVDGTMTQKAFTDAVASMVDDILGINND